MDEATHDDDGVREVGEGVDDADAAFLAAREPLEGVLPGVRALDMPALASLDGRLLPLVRNRVMQAAFADSRAGWGRVIPGVQVHGDGVGQGAEVI